MKLTRSKAAGGAAGAGLLLLGLLLLGGPQGQAGTEAGPEREVYIVQGPEMAETVRAVAEAGGEVVAELAVIRAVAAQLSVEELELLRGAAGEFRIHANEPVRTTGKPAHAKGKGRTSVGGRASNGYLNGRGGSHGPGSTIYPSLVRADLLHAEGLLGRGITVAVLDTGMWQHNDLKKGPDGRDRLLARYCPYEDRTDPEYVDGRTVDKNGHGSHITSVIVNRGSENGKFYGVAPEADLVIVKAFDGDGHGTYLDVIQGIDWVVANKDLYGIRVLNLSFSGPVRSRYWEDPLNQAVMAAWAAGIVVVTSSGNQGPESLTVGVPGNVPYVVTVGAFSDNYTPEDRSDDYLTSFSGVGPTTEGFVKPELLAPGGHILGLMYRRDTIPTQHPEFHDGGEYFVMSGTSQSTAVVSGIAALILQSEPWLSPDDVKCRLMSASRPAVDGEGNLAYSVFQQGAGAVDAYDAVHGEALGCANRGLDVEQDLAGTAHFEGRAEMTRSGDFIVGDLGGYIWTYSETGTGGFYWNDAFLWGDGFAWSDAYLWGDGFLWNDAYMWSDGYLWNDGLLDPMAINAWVDQE